METMSLEEYKKLMSKQESTHNDMGRAFDTYLNQFGYDLPKPVPEHKFYHPMRKWAFDRAWLAPYQVAVEFEGGVYGTPLRCPNCGELVRARKKDGSLGKVIHLGGGHTRFARFLSDKEKYNTAAANGWTVLRFVRDDVYGKPFEMIEVCRHALKFKHPLVARETLPITEAEREIIYLVAAGYESSGIAERLNIKEVTVRGRVGGIFQKLGVCNRASAVARSLSWGIIEIGKIPWADQEFMYDAPEDFC